MDDPTLGNWNEKMVAATQAIRIKSNELTKNQKQNNGKQHTLLSLNIS